MAEVARAAGLHYGFDDEPGLSRRRRGRGFSYVDGDGNAVSSRERARLEALAIPPAWTDVWISPEVDNHILATGRSRTVPNRHRTDVEADAVQSSAMRSPFVHEAIGV